MKEATKKKTVKKKEAETKEAKKIEEVKAGTLSHESLVEILRIEREKSIETHTESKLELETELALRKLIGMEEELTKEIVLNRVNKIVTMITEFLDENLVETTKEK